MVSASKATNVTNDITNNEVQQYNMEIQQYNMEPFSGYLSRNKMDTKDHQLEGVQWCLRIEK